jgi:hypothetical protein
MVIFMWGSFSYMCTFINIVEIHPCGTFDQYDKFSFILRTCINLENFIIISNSSICVDSILVVNFIFKDSFSSMSIISYVSSLSPYGQLNVIKLIHGEKFIHIWYKSFTQQNLSLQSIKILNSLIMQWYFLMSFFCFVTYFLKNHNEKSCPPKPSLPCN